jgi:hypothetical protein
VQSWQKFEHLVARLHKVLGGDHYTVDQDITIAEPSGAEHQIDVVVTPKSPFLGRILISCKSGAENVGMDHVREWSDIVQHTGSASGVIVSPQGFTSGAIDLGKNTARRVSLWIARPLTDDDFAPDEKSPEGYIRRIELNLQIRESRPRIESFKVDAEAVTPEHKGQRISFNFSRETRDQFYLRDVQDNVVGNLWDDYIAAATSLPEGGPACVEPTELRFLIIEGHRVQFKSLRFEIDLVQHDSRHEIDLANGMYGYQNAVSGQVLPVPLV